MKFYPKVIKGRISAMLSIKNCPMPLKEEILEMFRFDNPKYLDTLRYSPYSTTEVDEYIDLAYENSNETGSYLFFPRGINIHKLSAHSKTQFYRVKWRDMRHNFNIEFPKIRLTLNREQKIIQKALQRALRSITRPFGNYLIIAPTSLGKTIAQAHVSAQLGQRVLILSKTNLIKRAWVDDLKAAYGITPHEIGLIQQKTYRIGKHFTVASIATLARRRETWKDISKLFGTVVLDESHIITAPTIHDFLLEFEGKNIVGATATSELEESRNYYMDMIFGSPIVRISMPVGDTATSMALQDVRVVRTEFDYDYDPENLDAHDLSMAVASDEERNQLIIQEVLKDYEKGYGVLIACKRISQTFLLQEMLQEEGVEDVNVINGETNTNKRYTDKLVNGIKAGKIRCIIGTVPAIKLGANMNPLSHLHVTYPPNRTDLTQLVGRIRRKAVGKTKTCVVYYLDQYVSYLRRRYNSKAIPVFRDAGVEKFARMFVT